MKRRYILNWIVAGLLAAVILFSIWAWAHRLIAPGHWLKNVWGFLCDPVALQNAIKGLGPWGPLALVALNVAQVVIAPLPGQFFAMLSGALFGPWAGGIWAFLGSTGGTAAVFWLARRFGRPFVARLVAKKHKERLDDLVKRRGRMFFFIAFLIPGGPHDLICYAIGLTALPLWQMLVLISIARLPGTFVGSYVGHKARELGIALKDAGQISPGLYWWTGATVVVLIVIWVVYLRWGHRIEEAIVRLAKRITHRT